MRFTRRSLLGALGASALMRPGLASAADGTAKNLIIVFAKGGWDTTYVFDPKPDAPLVATGVGDYAAFGNGALWFDAGRPNVTAYFERYGALTSVINGVNVPSVAHGSCTTRILTGYRDLTKPDIGAIMARQIGTNSPIPYLDIGGGARAGQYGADLGYMGNTNQLGDLVLEELASRPPDRSAWARAFLDEEQSDLVRQFVETRAHRQGAERAVQGLNAQRLQDFMLGLDRSHQLPDYADFFRNVGNDRTFEQQARIAAEALAAGLCRAAHLDMGVSFDTHADNPDQIGLYDQTFAGLIALFDVLGSTPSPSGGTLIDDTTVLVLSEMGRTPMLNDDNGKDHWPFTSCMVAGAGVRGHQVLGATNDSLVGDTVDFTTGLPHAAGAPLSAEHVLAGVLDLFGLDTQQHFPDVDVFRGFHA